MRLVVTEKPSVARDIARVLGANTRGQGYLEGNGLVVTWCLGHLCELEDPAHYNAAWRAWKLETLPMVPERFDLRVRKSAMGRWKEVRPLLRDRRFEEVINACDAGREGELIFRWVYELAECKLPVQRLWVSSMTDTAIRGAWAKLHPATRYDRLADAARCRSESDWLVGLNCTRALTCLARDAGGNQLLSVGRVQTPTLAMIVGRDLEIESFVPQDFWRVHARFTHTPDDADAMAWKAQWFNGTDDDNKPDDGDAPVAERLPTEADAAAVVAATEGQKGIVHSAGRKRTRERPPLLYDLTALQRRANQRYGMSAQRTLQVAQDLYEKHKLLTYPRTDARFLTPDQVALLPDIVRAVAALGPYQAFAQGILSAPIQPGKRVVNAAEVGDHHAILPTDRTPRPDRLNPDEKRIYDLVARRLLAALSADAEFEVTKLVVEVPPNPDLPLPEGITAPLRYRARGRVCVVQGWRAIDPPSSKNKKQVDLPPVPNGADAAASDAAHEAGKTRPPRPHNDATILRGMETAGRQLDDKALERAMRGAGLGTPATRANILQTLLDRQYIERKGRNLHATPKGRALIQAIPVDDLKSPIITGQWEARLAAMADGKGPDKARQAFMIDAANFVETLVAAFATAEPPEVLTQREDVPELGPCPVCGKPVRESRAVFSCDTGRKCDFVVFKKMSKRKISTGMVRAMLTSGRSKTVKGFRSKKGKPFSAAIQWDPERKRVGFLFDNDRPTPKAPTTPEGQPCPSCGKGTIIRGRTAYGCSRWREGCQHRIQLVA